MIKYLTILFLLFFFYCNGDGQSLSGPETVKNYSVAQKRLLVISTAQFANLLTQNNLDKDSIMIMACRITGMPFLLPFNEGFENKVSGGANFINAGKIADAVELLNKLDGENKIQLLVELGIWYLHQPGSYKKDLDSAKYFIDQASKLSVSDNYSTWQNECNFLTGELYFQQGRIEDGKNTLIQITTSEQNRKNFPIIAHAYELLGILLPNTDSMKLINYQKSFELYKQEQFKEKEIKLLWDIVSCHFQTDRHLAEKQLYQILSLQQAIGYKHTLYVQNLLAYSCAQKGKYLDALSLANAALQNLNWADMKTMAGAFFTRFGTVYVSLGKFEDAVVWWKKAIETRTDDNHIFWYKSLLYAASALIFDLGRAKEALLMITTVSKQYPPITAWEKMEILLTLGYCYDKIGEPKLADKNFMDFLDMIKLSPEADTYGELSGDYLSIGNLYIVRKNPDKARLFLKQLSVKSQISLRAIAEYYYLIYKIDSLNHNYKAALDNHIKFKLYYDSTTSMDQRKKMDELTVQYAAEKKDQDIKFLKQQGIVQQAELKQNKLTRNIMIAGSAMLVIFLGLLYNRFRLKQKTNKQLEIQQKEIAQKNTSLQELVEQKEWLLKEVHHRVKNNLQIIISLLNTQSNYLESDAAIKAIRESQERMNAISLIHQKLYKAEDTAFINIKEYVHELVEHIRNGFSGSSGIVFDLNISDSQMDVAQAVPLGLILNEAISNAFKYAFPGGSSGLVSISIIDSSTDKNYLVTISDNGVGLSPDYDLSKKSSFGIRLMQGLSKQLGGSFKIESDIGVKKKVAFAGSRVIRLFEKKKTNDTVALEIQDSIFDHETIITA